MRTQIKISGLIVLAFVGCVSCEKKENKSKLPEDVLIFQSRQQQQYHLKFVARPDEERFQITRVPSAKWPKRSTFLLRVGEVSEDQQFRVESFTEKEVKTETGVIVDASELGIVYLPRESQHTLVRTVGEIIPTYFAQLAVASDPTSSFYVKEGESFAVEDHPEHSFLLAGVKEDSVVVRVRAGEEEREIVILKR